jgi:hypothetical protein
MEPETSVIPRFISLFISSLIVILFHQACKKQPPIAPNAIASDTYYSKSSDTISTYQDYGFDLDGDGKVDYMFKYYYSTTTTIPPHDGAAIGVECADSNQIQYSSANRETKPILDSTMICDSTGWYWHSGVLGTAADQSMIHWVGNFVGTEPRNIGLRLNREGLHYYGWVKVLIADDGKLQIASYAYKLSANKPIMAGVHP